MQNQKEPVDIFPALKMPPILILTRIIGQHPGSNTEVKWVGLDPLEWVVYLSKLDEDQSLNESNGTKLKALRL